MAGVENGNDVHVVEDGLGEGNGAAGVPRMTWTNVMSGFMLRRFCDLVGQGVKCDKGFKEVHHNAVAKDVSDFTLLEVSGQQVYNHLRKWRARWVKVCRLKAISGALWDENNYMIVLDPEHLKSYCKDHPKDSDMLNVPLENYG
ncbi:hypothetical protein ACP70R_047998 [Stipagrostis hirtigluma subsp. patula]